MRTHIHSKHLTHRIYGTCSDLGVQVDGYTALVAHTIVIGEEGPATEPVKGKAADVMAAAYFASECAIRMLKIGAKVTSRA